MADPLLSRAQAIIKERLCGKALPTELRPDMDDSYRNLHSVLQRTVQYGESNSVIIIGAKGCGKSTLVNKVVSDIRGELNAAKSMMTVHLSGYLQTDDRRALDEITRQLQLENVTDDKVFGSFAETLAFLLEALRTGGSTRSRPILFILEEFDLFAHHKNQTLLYNLFDIAQACTTPLAVVGLTCRLDVMGLLEKRVKSRFSHRQIYISNQASLQDYVRQFSLCLKLPNDLGKGMKGQKAFVKNWNAHMNDLTQNTSVTEILSKQFDLCKETPALHQLLMLPVCSLSLEHPQITVTDIVASGKMIFGDSKANMLHGLSVLELCLIVAMNHLSYIYQGEPFNFQMVYNEFLKFSQKKSHILQNYTKTVVLKSFEHLVELELLKTKDNSITQVSKLQKEYRPMVLLVEPSQLREAIDKYPNCPTDVKQWAESSIA